jgi:hypothetical protein
MEFAIKVLREALAKSNEEHGSKSRESRQIRVALRKLKRPGGIRGK